jgi:DNA ligase (NAD+)
VVDELLDINGFGSVMAKAVADYFGISENMDMALKTVGILNIEKMEKGDMPLNGKVFVITGSLNLFENRKALQTFIEEKGGKVSSSISANTSYLINNDTQSDSTKNKKAKELGVTIISEDEFVKEFGLEEGGYKNLEEF